MQLAPRLSSLQARTLAVQFKDGDVAPAFKTSVGLPVLNHFRRWANKHPDLCLGVWVWPDGLVSIVPVPPEGTTLLELLGEVYEFTRTGFELQMLHLVEAGRGQVQSKPAETH